MEEKQTISLNPVVVEQLAKIDHLSRDLLAITKEMCEADGCAVYGMDLLAIGATNRAIAHCSGFKTMIEDRNLICAGSILRLQIDTAIRFYAAYLVDEPHDFALAVLKGRHIREMTDKTGNKMTDRYLVEKLSSEAEWLSQVYRETSGYVHFSHKHLMSAFTATDDHQMHMKVAPTDKALPDSIYLEALEAFCTATHLFMKYLRGWVFTKGNPELVQRARKNPSTPRIS